MNHDDAARAVAMRVRVFFRRATVRRPACVAYPVESVDRLRIDRVLEICKLTGGASKGNPLGTDDGHPGRIVPAVLHATESLEKDGYDGFRSDIANDSAHRVQFRVPGSGFRVRFLRSGFACVERFRRSTHPSRLV